MHACGKPAFSLLQLDANLIEEEPYNRLTQKNKRRLNEVQQNSNISEMWETGFQKPAKTNSISVGPSPVSTTHRFFRARPPTPGSKNVTC